MNDRWQNLLAAERLRPSVADANRHKTEDQRNPYESDFGRVIFSSACRRLHDKTQVFPLTSDDNIHSRLTHSLEVMNIGLSFAINLCGNSDFKSRTGLDNEMILRRISPVLKTSCLVHDIGNPPFGHFGEEAIQCYFKKLLADLGRLVKNQDVNEVRELSRFMYNGLKAQECNSDFQIKELESFLENDDFMYDYTQFDGNAQGFRVLSKLQYLGDLFGLNLTYATLASTLKYPNYHSADKKSPNIGTHKHGIFYTEQEYACRIMDKCGLFSDGKFKRHPLSFLMEAADSICYLIMDLEDAIKKQWLNLKELVNFIHGSDIAGNIKCTIDRTKGNNTNNQKDLVNFRTEVLSHLMQIATTNFVNNLDAIEAGTYNKELIRDNDNLAEVLQKIAMRKVYANREIISLEMTGDAVISGILDFYLKYLFHDNMAFRNRAKTLLSQSIMMAIIDEHKQQYGNTEYFKNKYGTYDNIEALYEKFDVADLTAEERFRLVRDFVACMTDKFALNHFRKLNGTRI